MGNASRTNFSKGSWWSHCNTDSLTAEQTASVGLNVMMTPCWENHEEDAAVNCNPAGFTVGSIVFLWGLMTSKQPNDGLLSLNPLLYTLS